MSLSVDKIVYSKRRTISIQVSDRGEVIVRAPKGVNSKNIEDFIKKNHKWIEKNKQKALKNIERSELHQMSPREVRAYKRTARKVFKNKLDILSGKTGIKYKKLRLSGARKRWGSCNSKGVLSINWRLILTNEDLIDYVLLHELSHIKHLNHSKKYWQFIELHEPGYKKLKRELKEFEYLLLIE